LTARTGVVQIVGGDGDQRRRRRSWRGRSRARRLDSLCRVGKSSTERSMASMSSRGDAPITGEKSWPGKLGFRFFPKLKQRERGN
jgi:hypothetical protein